MKLQTTLDITALETFKKMEHIAAIERKMQRLSYAPTSAFALMMLYCLILYWLGVETITPQALLGVVGIFGGLAQAMVKRGDLLQQWITLKMADTQH